MRTVRLVGELGKKFGEVHRFSVKSPSEAIRALVVNCPGFEKELNTAHERNVGFKVINGGDEMESVDEINFPASHEIVLVPVIMGAGAVTRIILGAALIAAAFLLPSAASPYLISAGLGLALGGIVQLLSPVPSAPKVPEKPENTPSYNFNGPVNTTAQGHPVPLGYGRLVVGGALISAGISIQQLKRGFIRKAIEKTVVRRYFLTQNVPGGPWVKEFLPFTPAVPKNYFKTSTSQTTQFVDGEGIITVYAITYYYYDYILVEA